MHQPLRAQIVDSLQRNRTYQTPDGRILHHRHLYLSLNHDGLNTVSVLLEASFLFHYEAVNVRLTPFDTVPRHH